MTATPGESRTLGDLWRLPGVQEVRRCAHGFDLTFPEAEVVITIRDPGPGPSCETE